MGVIVGTVVAVAIGGGAIAFFAGALPGGPGSEVTAVPTDTGSLTGPTDPATAGPAADPLADSLIWPLTGVPGDVVERPALAGKVENSAAARPQEGLDAADIVFEEMVEGGISRYLAIYHSVLPYHVVPVRSIRPMDAPIAAWTGGIIAYAGGKDRFEERAAAAGLQLISTGSGLGRVAGRAAPHNLAANPEKLLARADAGHQGAPPPFATFAKWGTPGTAETAGTPATQLTVTISASAEPRWRWDGDRWWRWEGNDPALGSSGAQLTATNVLILGVDVEMRPEVDAAGTHVPESIVVGAGSGLLASAGATWPITWRKDSDTAAWQFLDASGAPVVLVPGNTWVELVPNGTGNWSVE
jgi:hypothetical protein